MFDSPVAAAESAGFACQTSPCSNRAEQDWDSPIFVGRKLGQSPSFDSRGIAELLRDLDQSVFVGRGEIRSRLQGAIRSASAAWIKQLHRGKELLKIVIDRRFAGLVLLSHLGQEPFTQLV